MKLKTGGRGLHLASGTAMARGLDSDGKPLAVCFLQSPKTSYRVIITKRDFDKLSRLFHNGVSK